MAEVVKNDLRSNGFLRLRTLKCLAPCIAYPPAKTLLLPVATLEPQETGSPIRPSCLVLTKTVELPFARTPP